MDEELRRLEHELTALRPVPPTAAGLNRLERELALPAARGQRPRRRGWAWLALPAAAALAFLWWRPALSPSGDAPAQAGADTTLKPMTAVQVLYAAEDDGLVTLADGTRARRERLHFVDTIVWRNPRTNASVAWTVPREEVRFVPVTLH